MKEGTKSYLFGCHQFLIHSLIVLIAWIRLYKKPPKFWQIVCIFLHDIGHVGKNYLSDYEQKKGHWILGSDIALYLFGHKGWLFIAGHTTQSEILSAKKGEKYFKSDLFLADKYSWVIAPKWWLRLNDKVEGFDKLRSLDQWHEKVVDNWHNGCPKGNHQIFLELEAKSKTKNGHNRMA